MGKNPIAYPALLTSMPKVFLYFGLACLRNWRCGGGYRSGESGAIGGGLWHLMLNVIAKGLIPWIQHDPPGWINAVSGQYAWAGTEGHPSKEGILITLKGDSPSGRLTDNEGWRDRSKTRGE